mmetsp:Transcript_29711/g.45453  ORF Transcript_29711/g.45453 Transcript_29711/m.45453 type:complete len:546 (-) Transcript_29711:70-1707(-)
MVIRSPYRQRRGSSGSGSRSRSGGVRHENFLYMRASPALSWRLDPDESLSDWTLRVSCSNRPKDLNASTVIHANGSPVRGGASNLNTNMNTTANTTANTSLSSLSTAAHASPLLLYNCNAVTKTYFVHRTQLAVGPRRSEYFAKLFKAYDEQRNYNHTVEARDDMNHSTEERSSPRVTKIELLPSAASAFPAMLDYLYSAPGSPIDVDTKNAVALRHLASSFGIKPLFHETTKFIKNDLNSDTAHVYLIEAKIFQNAKVVQAALHAIASDFRSAKMTALACLPPKSMVEILQSAHLKGMESEALSSKIASYCKCREEDLTADLLESMTTVRIMPRIAEQESLYYIHLVVTLGDESRGLLTSPTSSISNSSLTRRCLEQAPKLLQKVISNAGDLESIALKMSSASSLFPEGIEGKLAERQQQANKDIYDGLPDSLKVQLLEKAFGAELRQQNQVQFQQRQRNSSQDLRQNQISSLGTKKAKRRVMQQAEELEMMKTTYEKKMEYLQNRLMKKDEELKNATDDTKKRVQIAVKSTTPIPLRSFRTKY